jgi:hypothetical protein
MKRPSEGKESAGSGARPSSSSVPELGFALALVRRAQNGDLDALRDLLWSYRDRLRRIVAIRTGARLRALFEADRLEQDAYLLALRKLGDHELGDHAGVLQWLARIVESQMRSRFDYFVGRRKPDEERQLRMSAPLDGMTEITLSHTSAPRDTLRVEFERLVDSHVEKLEPAALREVLLLRDYFGEEWEAIRSALRLADVDGARELYKQAHEKLRRRLRPHLEKRGGKEE